MTLKPKQKAPKKQPAKPKLTPVKPAQKPKLKKLTKKEQLLIAYKKNAGNITKTCKAVGVDRQTFYNYKEKDPKFAEGLALVWDGLVDLMESALLTQIKKGDTKAIIFGLKTQGKKRNWTEKQEIKLEGSVKLEQITGIVIN